MGVSLLGEHSRIAGHGGIARMFIIKLWTRDPKLDKENKEGNARGLGEGNLARRPILMTLENEPSFRDLDPVSEGEGLCMCVCRFECRCRCFLGYSLRNTALVAERMKPGRGRRPAISKGEAPCTDSRTVSVGCFWGLDGLLGLRVAM